MPGEKALPPEEEAIREHLKKLDPRLLLIYIAWYGHFDGTASAEQLRQYFVKRGYEWAHVHRSTFVRWMRRVDDEISSIRSQS